LSIKVKRALKFIFLFTLTIIFLYLAYRGNDFSLLFEELKKANYAYALTGSFIGVVIGGYIRALRWRYFLDPLKKNIGMEILFSSMMVGYMMNSIIPRSGEIYRPVLLANREGISKASVFGTIVVERIFDIITLLVAFGFCLFFYREKLSNTFADYNLESFALYTSLAVLVFVIFILVILFNIERSEIIIERVLRNILPKKFHDKIHKFFMSLINGFLFIKYPKYYFKILALSILLWLSYVTSVYLTFFAFNIELSYFDANLVQTMITFAMVVPLPANSAGLFHLFCTVTLVNIFGIEKETAFGFATVNHLLGLLSLILIGVFYFIKENYKIKDSNLEEITNE
jgi:glycosyltransferase 2 family protein